MSKSMQRRLSAQKHPAAIAWDEWIESDAGKSFADILTLKAPPDQRRYLQNRLWHAFMAGYKAADNSK